MSKKRGKIPKPKQIEVLLASEIDYFILNKYEIENNGFWDWFFGESEIGDTNILSLHENEHDLIQPHLKQYFKIILAEFIADADDELCLEIENDI